MCTPVVRFGWNEERVDEGGKQDACVSSVYLVRYHLSEFIKVHCEVLRRKFESEEKDKQTK